MIFPLGDRKQDKSLVLKNSQSGWEDRAIYMNQLRVLNCGLLMKKEFREGRNECEQNR